MSSRRKQHTQRGFSMLETVIAFAILAVASAGALNGLLAANSDLRKGQLRQYEMALVDATLQRMMLSDKSSSVSSAVPPPATSPPLLPIGAAPWAPDPTSPSPGDLSRGAYFRVLPDGEITPDTTIPAGTPCNAATLPDGIYCREMVLTSGMPAALGAHAGIMPAQSLPLTFWVRVFRKGENPVNAVVHRMVLVQ